MSVNNSPPDFSSKLTVFVISSGEETEEDCLSALAAQDSTFRIEHIRNVSPMSAAFQAMPDRCETPYFVQLDADMILEPFAVRSLYEAVIASPFWIYRIAGSLYEEGFGVGGTVKCWKRSVFRLASFHDCRTVDRDFHNRVRMLGLRVRRMEDIFGIHRPRHSGFSMYLKTKADVEKWRFLKRPVERYALPLFDEILDSNYESRPCRLFGAMTGAMTGADRLVRSKDTPLEEQRLSSLLDLLGQNISSIDVPVGLSADTLRSTFSEIYSDYRTRNPDKRKHFTKTVLEAFDRAALIDDGFVDRFLRVVDE